MKDKKQRRKLRKQKKALKKRRYVPKHFVGVVGWTLPDWTKQKALREARQKLALQMEIEFVGTSDSACQQAVRRAIASLPSAVKPGKSAYTTTESRRCFATVRETVSSFGGRAVTGWSVMEISPKLPQKNPLAKVVLNAHCVWEKDGVLLETVEARQGLAFIPAPLPTPDAGIEFYDRIADAKRVLPDVSFENEKWHHVFVNVAMP